jgi:hypothetical protein
MAGRSSAETTRAPVPSAPDAGQDLAPGRGVTQ